MLHAPMQSIPTPIDSQIASAWNSHMPGLAACRQPEAPNRNRHQLPSNSTGADSVVGQQTAAETCSAWQQSHSSGQQSSQPCQPGRQPHTPMAAARDWLHLGTGTATAGCWSAAYPQQHPGMCVLTRMTATCAWLAIWQA